MSVRAVNRWSNTGTSLTASCTCSGARPGNLLVATCIADHTPTNITSLLVSTAAQSAGWDAGKNVDVYDGNHRIGYTFKDAEGTSDDNVSFTLAGDSSIEGWEVVVLEFNFAQADIRQATSSDTSGDSSFEWGAVDEWPGGTFAQGLVVVALGCCQGTPSPASAKPAYDITSDPNGYTWDTTYYNNERIYGDESMKYSIGYCSVDYPATGNEPLDNLTYAGTNIDASAYFIFLGESRVVDSGSMLAFTF